MRSTQVRIFSRPIPSILSRPIAAATVALFAALPASGQPTAPSLEPIVLGEDGDTFRYAESGLRFRPWGFNYNRDFDGQLLHEYWRDDWDRVVADFRTMRDLGANVVRIHLQTTVFMRGPNDVNPEAIDRLRRLIDLAAQQGLYLNLTGLGSYKDEDPAWYDEMDETERWEVHARFWEAVADAAAGQPAVFCYDLMNEPILTGGDEPNEWLPEGGFGNFHFVQRITRDLDGRTRKNVARDWVDTLVAAIRNEDPDTLITVGVIPWVFHWEGGSPTFYSDEVGENLDFASVHFYPRRGEIDKALKALAAYDVGKPLVIEETATVYCSLDELDQFIKRSRSIADGWIGFFWGYDIDYYTRKARPVDKAPYRDWDHKDWIAYKIEHGDDVDPDLQEARSAAMMRDWLTYFQKATPRVVAPDQ
jgi:hypothetical protein